MARAPEAQHAVAAAQHAQQWQVAQRLFQSVDAFILACILNRDTPCHIMRELKEAAEAWNDLPGGVVEEGAPEAGDPVEAAKHADK